MNGSDVQIPGYKEVVAKSFRGAEFLYTLRLPGGMRYSLGLRFLTRPGGRPTIDVRQLLRSSFGPFIGVYFLFYAFQYISIPLYPVYFVNNLLDVFDPSQSRQRPCFQGHRSQSIRIIFPGPADDLKFLLVVS